MSYLSIANMAQNPRLIERITACIAQERPAESPSSWASANIWQLAASPGWADAWEYAINGGEQTPGTNPGVITDGMILAAVQGRIADLEAQNTGA